MRIRLSRILVQGTNKMHQTLDMAFNSLGFRWAILVPIQSPKNDLL